MSLVSNHIEHDGLLALADALQSNRSVLKIALERNPVQEEAIKAFWLKMASVDLQRGSENDIEFVNIGI